MRATTALRAAMALTAGLAAACGSLLESRSAPATVYLLSAPAASPGQAVAADLEVLKPRVRFGLNNDRIAALYPDRHLDYYAGARWSGPLDEVVMDLALQSFRAGSGLRSVGDAGTHMSGGYWMEIEVVDFQAQYDGPAPPTVHVRLLAQIGDPAGHELGHFEASAQRQASANRLGAIVEAYNETAGAAFAELVAESATLLGKASEGR